MCSAALSRLDHMSPVISHPLLPKPVCSHLPKPVCSHLVLIGVIVDCDGITRASRLRLCLRRFLGLDVATEQLVVLVNDGVQGGVERCLVEADLDQAHQMSRIEIWVSQQAGT